MFILKKHFSRRLTIFLANTLEAIRFQTDNPTLSTPNQSNIRKVPTALVIFSVMSVSHNVIHNRNFSARLAISVLLNYYGHNEYSFYAKSIDFCRTIAREILRLCLKDSSFILEVIVCRKEITSILDYFKLLLSIFDDIKRFISRWLSLYKI